MHSPFFRFARKVSGKGADVCSHTSRSHPSPIKKPPKKTSFTLAAAAAAAQAGRQAGKVGRSKGVKRRRKGREAKGNKRTLEEAASNARKVTSIASRVSGRSCRACDKEAIHHLQLDVLRFACLTCFPPHADRQSVQRSRGSRRSGAMELSLHLLF